MTIKNDPPVIGLTGYAQSGKDTVGTYLVNAYGYHRVAFADAVRDAVYTLDPILFELNMNGALHTSRVQSAVDDIGWEEAKVQIVEVRRLLQVMGTEVGRMLFGENVWVDIAAKKAMGYPKVVITDVRFPNEAEWIKNQGGTIIKIVRPGVGPVSGHASEALDFEVDHEILNWGTPDDLFTEVDAVLY